MSQDFKYSPDEARDDHGRWSSGGGGGGGSGGGSGGGGGGSGGGGRSGRGTTENGSGNNARAALHAAINEAVASKWATRRDVLGVLISLTPPFRKLGAHEALKRGHTIAATMSDAEVQTQLDKTINSSEKDAASIHDALARLKLIKSRGAATKSAALPDIINIERALRDAGLSRTEAKALLAEGYKGLPLRDAEGDEEMVAVLNRAANLFRLAS